MLDFFKSKTKKGAKPTLRVAPTPTITVANPHAEQSNEVIQTVIKTCLWLSTSSGTFCLGAIILNLLSEWIPLYFLDETNFFAYYGYNAFCYAVGLKICHVIDFYGIDIFTKFAAFEVALMVSGSSKFNAWRQIAMFFWSIVAAAFIAASLALSWYGSEIVTAITGKQNSQVIKMIDEATKGVDEKQYSLEKKAVDDIIARKDAALAQVGNKEMRDLAKSGNSWAISELAAEKMRTSAKFDKELAKANEALAAAVKLANEKDGKAKDLKLSVAKDEIQATKTKARAFGLVGVIFGVAPLIVAVILLIIAEMENVVNEVITQKQRAKEGAGEGK